MGDGPQINEKFPIRESLSPPVVASPIPECSEAVYVSGFVPHAKVRVFANVTELLAEETPPFGFAEMKLNRQVKQGESLTATQTVNSSTSLHSLQPVVVSALNESAVKNTKPDVGKQLFECGIVVPVGNLVPGVRVHVTEDGLEIGNEPVAQQWHPVITSPLHANAKVSARQVACEGTSHEIKSPPADDVIVKLAPSPTPTPQPQAGSMIPGNDTVTLTGLLVGAGVQIFDHGTSVSSGWFATGDANYFPLSQPISATSEITATQELCGEVSRPSDPVRPSGRLKAPIVVGPICAGSRFVIIRATTINATVVLMRNGSVVGYGGAAPGDVIIAMGGNQALNSGDVVTAVQYVGSTISPTSNSVTVVRRLGQPYIEILGGEPFFLAKGKEQPIDGPVFPRGRGAGPVIRVQACCTKNVRIQLLDPDGKLVADPQLVEMFPGYFTATWTWTSLSNWAVPGGIPVGRYTVVAHTGCEQEEARASFYVIFNPVDVGGPQRFSFDDTAVWFGTGNNSVRGLHYYLHLSDWRVFSIAIKAVSGKTDSYDAGIAVARGEEQLFAYSLDYHTQDVVDLIANYTEAQCADDACCLTALLRAVGIPAHPVTADAGLETGAADWTFDTWVEFLAQHSGSTDWRIFHPHEYPGMQPESRGTFGTTRGVATKTFNDLVIMANENWDAAQLDDGTSDVSYSRNSCQEPNQGLNKAAWIGELCEQGYWTTPHWDCAGVSPSSFQPGNGFRFHDHELKFGGRLAGIVHIINLKEKRDFGRLAVELVAHLPESKKFPEISFCGVAVPAVLDCRDSLTVPFDLRLPKTLPPGRELFLWAHLDGHTAVLHELHIPPRVSCKLISPASYGEGEAATVRAIVTNTSDEPVRDVVVKLGAPYALQVERTHQCFEEIRPYEAREVEWQVRSVAPLRSGSLHVSVATANGGGIIVRRPFNITRAESQVEAQPGFFPKTRQGKRP